MKFTTKSIGDKSLKRLGATTFTGILTSKSAAPKSKPFAKGTNREAQEISMIRYAYVMDRDPKLCQYTVNWL